MDSLQAMFSSDLSLTETMDRFKRWISDHSENKNNIFLDFLYSRALHLRAHKHIDLICAISKWIGNSKDQSARIESRLVQYFSSAVLACNEQSHRKNFRVLKKIFHQWEDGHIFSSTIIDSLREILSSSDLFIEVDPQENKDPNKDALLLEACVTLNLFSESLPVPVDVLFSAYQIIHATLPRIDMIVKDIPYFCLAALFLSGKIWWDHQGKISMSALLDGFINRIALPLNNLDFKFSGIEDKIKAFKKISHFELQCLVSLAFDFSMFKPLSKFTGKILDRLRVDDKDKEFILSKLANPIFGFSPMCIFEDLKTFICAIIVFSLQSSTDFICSMVQSMKIKRESLDEILHSFADSEINWIRECDPILKRLKSVRHISQNKLARSQLDKIPQQTLPFPHSFEDGEIIEPPNEPAPKKFKSTHSTDEQQQQQQQQQQQPPPPQKIIQYK